MKCFQKYNWVDVKEYAELLFDNYEYTLAVAEDMWNLIMFKTEVPYKNIAKGNLTHYEKGDMIVWLLAIYSIIFDFQCVVGEETHYMEHDVGLCDYSTYNLKNYYEKLEYFVCEDIDEDIFIYLSEYMKIPSLELLNQKMKEQEIPKVPFYNVEGNILNFEYSGKMYDGYDKDYKSWEHYPIAYEALEIEVSKRSKEINRIIYNYFDGNTTKLLYFFTGYHYRDFYTDYLDRKNKLIEEREEKLRQLTQEKSDIIEDYEDKIRELDRDYPLFIMGLDEIINNMYDENFELLLPIYNWIENEIY
ncbi:MAG: hypothetical protein ACOX15_05190 [Tepidanaerobacteraceae bacterium]